ncbi:TIGR01457 family HAD-type hydrolase [Brevibacillus borstelensis]|uniref:TIGR01457 family HAD-type hydrolase n=1 Tax=Brevibacillus borstelensis TaxID=45462 RepID=UPI0004F3E2A4|nr:TIGR01457 family HAD-type hydrolase [Brevibacillus borstelensis]KKX54483.1 HAD family hydrolase [Brevibacillus borstelensis cifa_chp40]
MKTYRGYLLDLDGTIYRGKEVIPGAAEFILHLRKAKVPYLFLTNNSAATSEHVASRLQAMGIAAAADDVYTSAMATAHFLAEHASPGTPVCVIGEEGLRTELTRQGFVLTEEKPHYVIVGIDRAFTYEKLTVAARAIRDGATFIATNRDAALPSEIGLFPGNGSLVAAVSVASGKEPIVIGKPEPIIVRLALEKLGTAAEETLIVGDNLFTDIDAGAGSGIDTLHVLTGFSSAEDAQNHPNRPTHSAADLSEWLRRISS